MKSTTMCILLVACITSALSLFAGCSGAPEGSSAQSVKDIKVGVLSLVSALPVFAAEAEGYFEEEGLNVELITFNSALEQDAALQADEIDGYFSDPVNTIIMINGGVNISIINAPYKANSKNRMFAILASPQSGIREVSALKGVEVAISKATIIEYLQDEMMEHFGFTQAEIAGQEIKQIPIRMQLLLSGEIKAALLPETLVSLAEHRGARVIIDDTVLDTAETVIALDNSLMDKDATLKNRFLSALEKAVKRINSNSKDFSAILLANVSVAPEIQNTYTIPDFPEKALPSPDEIDEIQTWLVNKGIIDAKLPYDRIIK